MRSSSPTQQPSSSKWQQNAALVRQQFGNEREFKLRANPDAQTAFGQNPTKAVTGNYPTLSHINQAYGNGFAAEWLVAHITDLTIHTGAKNLNVRQVRQLAEIIATEYRNCKISELLLFFYRFKAGHYGHFYGTVDPMTVTCALRDFMQERNQIIYAHEQEQRELREAAHRKANPPISWEEYCRLKGINKPNPITAQ